MTATKTRPKTTARNTPQTRVTRRTQTRVRTSSPTKPRVKPRSNARWQGPVVLFAASVLVGFCASALLGQSFMESSRRSMVRAMEQARDAKSELSRLRERVGRLSSMGAVDQWAMTRGFSVADPSSLRLQEGNPRVVARR